MTIVQFAAQADSRTLRSHEEMARQEGAHLPAKEKHRLFLTGAGVQYCAR